MLQSRVQYNQCTNQKYTSFVEESLLYTKWYTDYYFCQSQLSINKLHSNHMHTVKQLRNWRIPCAATYYFRNPTTNYSSTIIFPQENNCLVTFRLKLESAITNLGLQKQRKMQGLDTSKLKGCKLTVTEQSWEHYTPTWGVMNAGHTLEAQG